MKNDKAKSKIEPVYTVTVELQAGRTAEFTYNDLELAGNHYDQLQAQQIVGHLGIKRIERSWRKAQ